MNMIIIIIIIIVIIIVIITIIIIMACPLAKVIVVRLRMFYKVRKGMLELFTFSWDA